MEATRPVARLLTTDQAAAYLNIPKAALKVLPLRPVQLGRYLRWDRLAIDQWLNGLSGLNLPRSEMNEAEAALDRWIAQRDAPKCDTTFGTVQRPAIWSPKTR